jgi:hypothetical protein
MKNLKKKIVKNHIFNEYTKTEVAFFCVNAMQFFKEKKMHYNTL